MLKKICLTMLVTSFSIGFSTASADSGHINGANIRPPVDGVPVVRTYVLATGTVNGGAQWQNVNIGSISKVTCHKNYEPSVVSAPIHSDVPHKKGWVSCDPHMRNINAQTSLQPNKDGGYDLLVTSGVQADSGCNDAPVTLNYVVYCQPKVA